MNLSKMIRGRIPLLACPVCHDLASRRGLCPGCAAGLWEGRAPVRRRRPGYHIYSLFSWRRDGQPGLRWWVRALKRKEHPAFWREAAIWALEAFPAPPPGSVIVPIPSSGRGKNHALGFARALSSWSGLEVRELLRSRPGLPQKGLSRRARRFRRFEPTVPAWNICTPVVIVDDVVTTGATLNAAWEALGRPGACQAWCLMDRRPT